jgi:zinc transport system ATP-binding protein
LLLNVHDVIQLNNSTLAIEVKNVRYSYGKETVIEHIDFKIEDGDYVAIIGPNGGGKSTLIKILTGLLSPSQGTVYLYGKSVDEFRKMGKIGYVPQKISQEYIYFPVTVKELLQSYLRNDDKERLSLSRILEMTNLSDKQNTQLRHLSGGQRQRAYIARALIHNPKLLILDEPTVGVDVTSQEKFYSFLRRINTELGITILFVSHDVEVITGQAKHIICLNKNLVCHTHTKGFMEQPYMEELYGGKVKHITHNH